MPFHTFCLALLFALHSNAQNLSPAPPYAASQVIGGVTFDFFSHKQFAPGSDNWPITWADDDHQYAAWGDGGGFGGTNSNSRVKLGVARIEGDRDRYRGYNVWGGFDSEAPAQFEGKSYGILFVEKALYMWVANQPNPHLSECRLARSIDYGRHWEPADWAFTFEDQLTIPTLLNYGKNYAGSRDDYVYSYYIHPTWGPDNSVDGRFGFDVHKPGKIYLSRTPKTQLLNLDRYEFFAGMNEEGSPVWSSKLEKKQPVFEDSNGVGWNLSVSYNPGLRRYLLCTEHSETHAGKLGIFEAPEPWGPWHTVTYQEAWGEGNIQVNSFFWNFSTKWLSEDGKRFVFLFTGKDSNDSWNTVEGHFVEAMAD